MSNGRAGAIAIIFAGGNGTRMKPHGPPKQFVTVGDRPILVHTLQHFQAHPRIEAIYVVCLADFIGQAWSLVEQYGLDKVRSIVPGGHTAQESIFNGLESAVADGVDEQTATLIHDGVRPIINADLIDSNIDTAHEHGSAITAIPCFETIAMSLDQARTIHTVTNRDVMYVLQAPQTFRLGEVHRTNRRSFEDGLLGAFVDQAQLMSHYGFQLHMVRGLRGNAKLTTQFDLRQFSLLVESGELDCVTGAHLS